MTEPGVVRDVLRFDRITRTLWVIVLVMFGTLVVVNVMRGDWFATFADATYLATWGIFPWVRRQWTGIGYRRGYWRGRREIVESFVEAQKHGMTCAEWVQVESERDRYRRLP